MTNLELTNQGASTTAIPPTFSKHPTESKSDSKSEAKTMQTVASEEAVDGGLPSILQ